MTSEAEKLITTWAWVRKTKLAYETERQRYDYDLNVKLLAIEAAMMDLAHRLKERS